MPQPLSSFDPQANIMIGAAGTKVFDGREHLAAMAMECVAAWSHVDAFMLNMYVTLAGGDASDAAAMYLALEGDGPKSAAITAIAKRKLSQPVLALFGAILSLVASAYKERNRLCHHQWGVIVNRADVLLTYDLRFRGNIDRKNVYVFRQGDFEALRQKFANLASYGRKLDFILMGHPANHEGRLYAKLCSVPEIAEKLDRQSRRALQDQSPQEESPQPIG